MNILNDKSDINHVTGVETEQVQLKQIEHTLLDTFLRTKGLLLFYYNPENQEMGIVNIQFSDTIHLFKISDTVWLEVDFEAQKCTVDAKCMYFEALNKTSALSRVERYKKGQIKELCNLKKPSKEGIKFY